jgi:hypothetical protein
MLLFNWCFIVHLFLLRHGRKSEYVYCAKLDAGYLDEEYEALQWGMP